MKEETTAIHAGLDNPNGGVTTPVDLSSTFRQDSLALDGFAYSRLSNPTVASLEKQLAALEDATYALAFSSGMGAISTTILGLLESGDEIIVSDDLYGGTQKFLDTIAIKLGITVVRVDAVHSVNVANAINDKTKMIYLETPTNPLLKIVSLHDICLVRDINLISNPLIVVDNTFATPLGQDPLFWGADIVLHSLTKYINGHSDVIAGAVMLNDKGLKDTLFATRTYMGTCMNPFDAMLVSRGIKTLPARMNLHEAGANEIAIFLEGHPMAENVLYPGLRSHPQHNIATQQMDNYGGMVTFTLKGDTDAVQRFLDALKIFTPAVSLGGVESLIEVPYFMTHGNMSHEEKDTLGITENMIRISIGIENIDDLLKDLTTALQAAK
ncbi:MAG: PLP-dependent aspartate aminotransferase family protein [Candidatus Spechtbacterales bacterium]|nr:PLP-dependent aspartate aminotransferase family protein [Candidatus Spechtbacterales bacterium]